jgi:hypothetical protein
MHGIGASRTDSMHAVITGMCILLLVPRQAPGLGTLLCFSLSQGVLESLLELAKVQKYKHRISYDTLKEGSCLPAHTDSEGSRCQSYDTSLWGSKCNSQHRPQLRLQLAAL